eukprot:CAMPEP_0172319386 /NCGR_PEP_ID=MMETSP1058-20130122/37500_1 /TAXON_ID=83371 /ORGANISM="Detonula confervacea, Strain CCMP 353" /LENGTH=251 /DNA_ID=CAMNT_0013034413 /DNA_START=29 /DNA_END=784 /DNA_ORIENTATION=+
MMLALVLQLCLLVSTHAFNAANLFNVGRLENRACKTSSSSVFATNKWDMLIDEDEDLEFNGPPVTRDMKYNVFNIKRQRENFESIKAVAGADLTNDVYARDAEKDTFWFIGKVARVSDIPLEKAMARQWPMIEEHSARLRPVDLYPKFGSLQLWTAPGDSEIDVAYCKPEIVFVQMFRDVDDSSEVRNMEVGFAGELYESDEEGFRTKRTNDGKAVKQEIQIPSDNQRQPTNAELDEMMKELAQAESDGGQ